MKVANFKFFALALFFPSVFYAQDTSANSTEAPPAINAIKESDLKADIFYLASDEMRGRRAGTIDELNAAAWVAKRAAEAGLQPAGDNGTYFQFFPLYRTRVATNSEVSINGEKAGLWKDIYPVSPVETRLNNKVM